MPAGVSFGYEPDPAVDDEVQVDAPTRFALGFAEACKLPPFTYAASLHRVLLVHPIKFVLHDVVH